MGDGYVDQVCDIHFNIVFVLSDEIFGVYNGMTGDKDNFSAVDSKFDYEYLVRFKSMSFIHVQWLSAHEIGYTCN